MTKKLVSTVLCVSVQLGLLGIVELRAESLALSSANSPFAIPVGTTVKLVQPVPISTYLQEEGYQIEIFTPGQVPSWTHLTPQQSYSFPLNPSGTYTTSFTRTESSPGSYLLPFSAQLIIPESDISVFVPIAISQQGVASKPLTFHESPVPSSLVMMLTMLSSVGLVFGYQRWKTRRNA